jgi:hypothetical protein
MLPIAAYDGAPLGVSAEDGPPIGDHEHRLRAFLDDALIADVQGDPKPKDAASMVHDVPIP